MFDLANVNATTALAFRSVTHVKAEGTSLLVQLLHRVWSGGAMVLGKFPVPGRPTNLDYSMTRIYCACSRCGLGLFGHLFSLLSPPLWETARYRLTYCLKGPLSLKQPTNQPVIALFVPRSFRRKAEGHCFHLCVVCGSDFVVGTLSLQLLLQFYVDLLETLQML